MVGFSWANIWRRLSWRHIGLSKQQKQKQNSTSSMSHCSFLLFSKVGWGTGKHRIKTDGFVSRWKLLLFADPVGWNKEVTRWEFSLRGPLVKYEWNMFISSFYFHDLYLVWNLQMVIGMRSLKGLAAMMDTPRATAGGSSFSAPDSYENLSSLLYLSYVNMTLTWRYGKQLHISVSKIKYVLLKWFKCKKEPIDYDYNTIVFERKM